MATTALDEEAPVVRDDETPRGRAAIADARSARDVRRFRPLTATRTPDNRYPPSDSEMVGALAVAVQVRHRRVALHRRPR
jgi:hypothetical protein